MPPPEPRIRRLREMTHRARSRLDAWRASPHHKRRMKTARRVAVAAAAGTAAGVGAVDVAVGGLNAGPLIGLAAGGFAVVTLAGLWIQQ